MVSYQSGGEVLRPGARVAFSGRITVNNELVPQGEKLRELCSEVGLVYKTVVLQTGCDAVVADSLTTAKVRRAADYGKPVVSVADFSGWCWLTSPLLANSCRRFLKPRRSKARRWCRWPRIR